MPPGSSGPEPAYPGGVSSTPAQPEPTEPDSTDSPVEPAGQDAPALEASPAATGDSPVSIPADGPLSDAQLAAIAASAQPATVRRAPRYKGFFWTGALVGIVLGVFFGLGLSYDGMVNRWIYVVVTVLGASLVTTLVAGALAALVDKRGARRAAAQRAASNQG